MSHDLETRVEQAIAAIRERSPLVPEVAVVAGSGLGRLGQMLGTPISIKTADLPGYPKSTVEGHSGRLLLGRLDGRPVVVLSGRVHAYEGYSLGETTIPVRVMARLGADTLVLTNSAGGIAEGFTPGDIMLIDDHLNLQIQSPLSGPNVGDWGPRFPDMTEVYDGDLRERCVEIAARRGVELRRGVYASLPGPQYETPAEVRMLRGLGADAVGMSTVPEAIVARHMQLRVLGLSLISNAAAGLGENPLSHDEVIEAGQAAGGTMAELIAAVIESLPPRDTTSPEKS